MAANMNVINNEVFEALASLEKEKGIPVLGLETDYTDQDEAQLRTRIGAFLRKTSIDELPQLFNVLRGDMSLVGPRPPLPSEVAQYEPRVMGKFAVRPGITGLWQISGRSNLSWDETVHLDLSYAQHRSLTLDAWIMLQTIPALLRHEGAY